VARREAAERLKALPLLRSSTPGVAGTPSRREVRLRPALLEFVGRGLDDSGDTGFVASVILSRALLAGVVASFVAASLPPPPPPLDTGCCLGCDERYVLVDLPALPRPPPMDPCAHGNPEQRRRAKCPLPGRRSRR
jgi:hypothetical protein